MKKTIKADFPFKENFVDVLGSKMHYVDEGEGAPMVFLHGVPTWSYLWRNVIPELSAHARCVAPDLIGFGKSDKPDIEYTVFDHIKYFEAFIDALVLDNITLVLHAWGSVIGFDYAMRYPEKIKGLVFLESHIRPVEAKDMVSLMVRDRSSKLHMEQDEGFHDVIEENAYINDILPQGVLRKLSEEEMTNYRMPFPDEASRKPILQYLHDLPVTDVHTKVWDLIHDYSDKLGQSEIPKLMLYAIPGFNTPIDTVIWARDHLPNTTIEEMPDALHYAMESKPFAVAQAILKWYLALDQGQKEQHAGSA